MLRTYVRLNLVKARLNERLKSVLRGEEGATVSEYALVLALVTVAVITVLGNLGSTLNAKIQAVIDKLGDVNP